MENETRYVDPEGGFDLRIPDGWSAEPDPEEGGVEIWSPEGVGMLHLIGFPHESEQPTDPAEELYSFLYEQGVGLEEDEVEDIELAGGAEMAICEYIGQEEGIDGIEEESAFWLMGVAAGPGFLVFASYSCPAGEEEIEREAVHATLASLRIGGVE